MGSVRRRIAWWLASVRETAVARWTRRVPGVRPAYGAIRTFTEPEPPDAPTWIQFDGDDLLVDPQDNVGNRLYRFGRYEPAVTRLLERCLSPGDTAFDVGAHCGHHTLTMRGAVGPDGSVVAIEPNPDVFARLQQTVERNGFDAVALVEAAVSDTAGTAKLRLPERGSGDRATIDPAGHASTVGSEAVHEVRTVRLCDVARDRGIGTIDVLKMDVEGHEIAALRGLDDLADRVGVLVLEVHAHALGAERARGLVERLEQFSSFLAVDPAGGTRSIETPDEIHSTSARLLVCR